MLITCISAENNTIYGTKYHDAAEYQGQDPGSRYLLLFPVRAGGCDVSTVLLWGGVQKNVGPAGMVIVIIREDLITEDVLPGTPTMLQLQDARRR